MTCVKFVVWFITVGQRPPQLCKVLQSNYIVVKSGPQVITLSPLHGDQMRTNVSVT